jgi:hypothetical protein
MGHAAIPACILWLRCGRQGRAHFKPNGASASTLTLLTPPRFSPLGIACGIVRWLLVDEVDGMRIFCAGKILESRVTFARTF